MNELLKRGLILGAIGFAVGTLICLFIVLLGGLFEDAGIGFIVYYFISGGMLGAICNGTSAIYGIEKWSILRVTITHFVISLAAFYTFAFSIGWLIFGDLMFWIVTAMFVAAYFMIWLIQYLIYKGEVKRMNSELKELKKIEDEEKTEK